MSSNQKIDQTAAHNGVLKYQGMSAAADAYENKTEVAIYVILDPATGRVLMEWRLPPWPPFHQWTFGSGRVDPGESGSHAALREANEELGILVRRYADLGSFEDANGRTFHPFVVTEWSGEIPTTNGDEKYPLAWWDADKLPHGCNAVTHEVANRVNAFIKAVSY